MFSGEHSANDISSELFIGGSRRHNMGHRRVILRSKSPLGSRSRRVAEALVGSGVHWLVLIIDSIVHKSLQQ
jgi:hypothetical protein